MSDEITIIQYCKDPKKYFDKFSTEQIEYKSCLCSNMNKKSISEVEGTAAQYIFEGLLNFIEGLFGPMGLLQIGGLELLKYSTDLVFKAAAEFFAKGVTELSLELFTFLSETAFSVLAINMVTVIIKLS